MYALQKNFHCTCGKLLARGLLLAGAVEIKCRSCSALTVFNGHFGHRLAEQQCMVLCDETGAVKKISDRTSRVTGYTYEELMGMNAHERYYPELTASRVREYLLREGGPVYTEGVYTRKDGSEFRALTQHQRLVLDGTKYALSIMSVKEVEDLAAHADRVQPAYDFLFEVDMLLRCVFADRGVTEALGYLPAELLGTTILLQSAGSEGRASDYDLCMRLCRESRSFSIPKRVVAHKNGEAVMVESTFIPRENDLGVPIGYQCMNKRLTSAV